VRPFEYVRADDVGAAVATVTADAEAAYLAGGTTQLDLMLKDGIVEHDRLVDITRLPLRGVTAIDGALQVGALTTMEELAADPTVAERAPLVREALLAGASTQLRNMATIGGNVLQRTRCRYFRDPAVTACNKRVPGSGCAAVAGAARMHAILGASEHCIALHASDLCVALVALDAVVHIRGVDGERTVPLTEFYVLPGDRPDIETVLRHGELVTALDVPLLPVGVRSGYLKVRDRASYEFALASAGAALAIEGDAIADVHHRRRADQAHRYEQRGRVAGRTCRHHVPKRPEAKPRPDEHSRAIAGASAPGRSDPALRAVRRRRRGRHVATGNCGRTAC
jgi:xanthine dehydrogenase YagS FAD-binding subunit